MQSKTHRMPGIDTGKETSDPELSVIAMATDEFLASFRESDSKSPEQFISEFVKKYPGHEANLRELLPALVGLENLAGAKSVETANSNSADLPSFEDYELIREIGRGGMGVVYEARQRSLDRPVALKVLNLDVSQNPTFLARFEREAQIAASLHHSNIVPVFDVGKENGTHYFSMQYIDGRNLSELRKQLSLECAVGKTGLTAVSQEDWENTTRAVNDNSDLTWVNPKKQPDSNREKAQIRLPFIEARPNDIEVARIGAQIADALGYIHRRGIVHRDIKPGNILLSQDGNAWLADWGLVKSEFSELTQTGDLFGSLPYMAPERFKGQADARSDIYSLGVTLYELATLNKIFPVKNHVELVGVIVNDAPIPPRKIDNRISPDFENVILKAIEKDADSRYQSATELAEDLHRLCSGRPVSARPLSGPEKVVRWCRNQPVIAGLVATIAALLIVGTSVSLFLAVSASRARDEAKLGQEHSEASLDVFFGTFFPQTGPDNSARMSPEVRQAMDEAVTEIMESSEQDPIVVGKLFNRLGWIYFNQQDYPNALKVFQHSTDRVTNFHGEKHPVAMSALDHVGMTLKRLNRIPESERALMRAWSLQAETLGMEHESTIHSYAKLGDLYHDMGHFEDSLEITKEVLAIRQRPNRPDGKFAYVSMNGLALTYIQLDQPEEAVRLLTEVIENQGSDTFSVNYYLHNLAVAHRHANNLKEAESFAKKALEIRLKELDSNSESVVSTKTLLAGILADQSRCDQAIKQLDSISDQVFGLGLPVREGMYLLEVGRCQAKVGNTLEAKITLQRAFATLSAVRSENNIYTRQAKACLRELEKPNDQ